MEQKVVVQGVGQGQLEDAGQGSLQGFGCEGRGQGVLVQFLVLGARVHYKDNYYPAQQRNSFSMLLYLCVTR